MIDKKNSPPGTKTSFVGQLDEELIKRKEASLKLVEALQDQTTLWFRRANKLWRLKDGILKHIDFFFI